jgi:hypothetical protein
VIAQLYRCNNNQSRHRWSEQKIHRFSFSQNGFAIEFVLLNYSLESGGYAFPIPHDVLMTLGYCKSPANPEIAGNPRISRLFQEPKR